MLLQLLNIFGKILLLLAFGFVLSKRGIMTIKMRDSLSELLVKIILPVNIISAAGQIFSKENAIGMLSVLLISSVYFLLFLVILSIFTKKLNVNKRFRSVFINVMVFANVGFIGFPLLGEMFGKTGTLYTVAYNMSFQLFFFSYGLMLLTGKEKISIRNLFSNKTLYVSIISIIIYLSGFRFPDFIQYTLSSIGGMMVPLSMMLIGWEIANSNFKEILCDRYAYMVSTMRLIFIPLIVAVFMKLMKIDPVTASSTVILSALPSGSLTVIMSQAEHNDSAFAARAVAQSTILMLPTLPLIFLFVQYFFSE